MEDSTGHTLDTHTYKSKGASHGKTIISFPLPVDDSLCLSASDVRTIGKEGYFCSIGIHPWKLTKRNAKEQFELLQRLLVKEQFATIGEAGFDKLTAASIEPQVGVSERQVELSEEYRLPLVIHCVKTIDKLLAVRRGLNPTQSWIWHNFRERPRQAGQLIKSGTYLFSGTRCPEEAVKGAPVGRLFLEANDSPVDVEEVPKQVAKTQSTDTEELRRVI